MRVTIRRRDIKVQRTEMNNIVQSVESVLKCLEEEDNALAYNTRSNFGYSLSP